MGCCFTHKRRDDDDSEGCCCCRRQRKAYAAVLVPKTDRGDSLPRAELAWASEAADVHSMSEVAEKDKTALCSSRRSSWRDSMIEDPRRTVTDTRFRPLLLQRSTPDADRGAIDAEITKHTERTLVACILMGHWGEKPPTRFDMLAGIVLLRRLCSPIVSHFGGDVLKWLDGRAFLTFEREADAVGCALACAGAAQEAGLTFPRHAMTLSAGVAAGKLLVFDDIGDFYGDPVNTASKLGEDTAQPGQVFVALTGERGGFSGCTYEAHSDVRISGITIPCATCKVVPGSELAEVVAGFRSNWRTTPGVDRQALVDGALSPRCTRLESDTLALVTAPNVGRSIDVLQQYECTATLLCTDMSGFSRLTKKHGILHYLGLIMEQRKMWDEVLPQYGGTLIKYDGDDIIAVFDSTLDCLCACVKAHTMLAGINRGRELDWQVRMGCGVAVGTTLVVKDILVGDVWSSCHHAGEDVSDPGEIVFTEEVRQCLIATPELACLAAHIEDSEDSLFKVANAAEHGGPLLAAVTTPAQVVSG
eukprot:TRINITY_DN46780_c0_g1_i1.p1 TRINITY_DN46780_c0_g1~~TRINITY_DN46780_c0_g1_i1.p1  ORF type:complete len:532 (+),score=144.36 TRINITY_DN46780_c0_g1_i1:102-1697(+)